MLISSETDYFPFSCLSLLSTAIVQVTHAARDQTLQGVQFKVARDQTLQIPWTLQGGQFKVTRDQSLQISWTLQGGHFKVARDQTLQIPWTLQGGHFKAWTKSQCYIIIMCLAK
ncbi:hypothetical protein BsWGS_02430 [Bradybaena similaris]